MNSADFKPGDQVRYVPHHAAGDAAHPDCENGIVSSTNASYVFVLYYHKGGGIHQHAQATSPEDLIKTT